MLPVRLGTFAFAVLLAEAAVLLAPFPRSSTPFVQGESQRRIVAPATCPITQPPSEPFVPPAPYPSKISSEDFWLGSEKLWTNRNKNGLWYGYWTTDDLGKHKIYYDKVFWWRKGYDWRAENPPRLKVSGRRLDASVAPFYVDHANPAFIRNPAMLTGIDIPTVGCWEITGDYKGEKLSFVVWVVDPPSDSP
jgi:hypothetical protein